MLNGRQNTNSSLQHYQPFGYVQRVTQPQHIFGTPSSLECFLEDLFYLQPNGRFQKQNNNLTLSLASQNSNYSSLFNSLANFHLDSQLLTSQEQKESSQSQPSQVSPESNSIHSSVSANNADFAPTYYGQAQPVQTQVNNKINEVVKNF